MTQPPTPDAIRAAIAEALADHPNIKLSVQVHRHVVAADVHDRLAQIGALRPVGDDMVAIPAQLAQQMIHGWELFQPGMILHDQFTEWVEAPLAQIGAVPAAGDGILIEPMSVQAMRIRRWAEFAFDHAECPEWDDEDQALYAALGTVANGADDGA